MMNQNCTDGLGIRQNHTAEGWLIQPDGNRNPGGSMCRKHAQEVIDEYRETLGENWAFEEDRQLENKQKAKNKEVNDRLDAITEAMNGGKTLHYDE